MRVLLIDYSKGFGGATKSIGMLHSAMTGVEYTVLTCQDDEQCRIWYAGLPVYRFRRVFNYASLSRFRRRASRTGGWLLLKLIAVADLGATIIGFLKISFLVRRHRIQLVHLNNGLQPRETEWAIRAFRLPAVVHKRAYGGKSLEPHQRIGAQVIMVSQSVRDFHPSWQSYKQAISVIWDPVDIALFDRTREAGAGVRSRLGIADDEVAVGIFGRIVDWKGQLQFTEACIRILDRGIPIRPVLVGSVSDGPESYLDAITQLVADSGHEQAFVFSGYQVEPAPFYHAMDIVVHFSLTSEPLGMVVPEAMIAGKAVIAANAGGPAEVITHDVDGRLVTPRDVDALAGQIGDLATDAPARERLGLRAAERARSAFSIAHASSATLRVYAQAMEQTT